MDPAVEELIRRGYAAFAAGDLETAMASFAPDVSMTNPGYALEGGTREGLAGMRTGLANLHGEFEFQSIDIEEITEGDGVVVVSVHIRARGRHSQVPMEQRFAHVWHWRDGQVVSFEWFLTREEALAAADISPR